VATSGPRAQASLFLRDMFLMILDGDSPRLITSTLDSLNECPDILRLTHSFGTVYTIDEQDSVVELPGVPQSDPGATCPIVVADEQHIVVSYSLPCESPDDRTRMPLGLVRFHRPRFHLFGSPNDEALAGHPLAGRGLRSYGAFRVDRSSLVRRLERMNSVHDRHNPERFVRLLHYIFTFHDSTFECVAESLESTVEVVAVNERYDRTLHFLRR
jgi:hypothetical protein